MGRGLAHWRGGRFVDAEACHRAALAVSPTHADAHHYLADTLRDGASQPVGASPGRYSIATATTGSGIGGSASAGAGAAKKGKGAADAGKGQPRAGMLSLA